MTFDTVELSERMLKRLHDDPALSSAISPVKGDTLYMSGEQDNNLYVIETGWVKVFTLTPGGKKCLLDIYGPGEIIGESCMQQITRSETATPMSDAMLHRVTRETFLDIVSAEGLCEDTLMYFTGRIGEQQERITNLVTLSSEERLVSTLLRLGLKIGRLDGGRLSIAEKITQEELSEMVGTTRSRIGHFLKNFRRLGLINEAADRFLILNQPRMQAYLNLRA
jgi:CRP/FNR family cyclic AMP-dependent transcriptional regulator